MARFDFSQRTTSWTDWAKLSCSFPHGLINRNRFYLNYYPHHEASCTETVRRLSVSPQTRAKTARTAWARSVGSRLSPVSPCCSACRCRVPQVASSYAPATGRRTPASVPWLPRACRKASSSGRSTPVNAEGWVWVYLIFFPHLLHILIGNSERLFNTI